ncbi:F-box protein SKIP24 [Vitis vinifera]|uniref:F-box protein SKIP24 n=1 Tax=Vitis vinifera TaxID=29760 RepID=A0A438HZF5_VITVI|nr:F-box protein SKIP24 [Vitis vinifera]
MNLEQTGLIEKGLGKLQPTGVLYLGWRVKLLGHLRNLQEIQMKLTEETGENESSSYRITELAQSQKVTDVTLELIWYFRQASVALNVWQPEVIRGWQKQMVGQCVVPVDARINALEMELKLCRQQIAGSDNAYRNEKRRLDAAKERLVVMKYHPLRDYKSTSSGVDECNSQRKKLKRGSDSKAPGVILPFI